jgi:hypothetical protein
LARKASVKLGLRKAWFPKRLVPLKKKPSTLHLQDHRKDDLTAFQELARPQVSQVQVYERVNSFESLSLEKRGPLGMYRTAQEVVSQGFIS